MKFAIFGLNQLGLMASNRVGSVLNWLAVASLLSLDCGFLPDSLKN